MCCYVLYACTNYQMEFRNSSQELWKQIHLGGIQTNDLCIARATVLPLDHLASQLARGNLESYVLAAGIATFSFHIYYIHGSVMVEWLRASNSISGVSDQQSVGLNTQPKHLCP